MKQVLFSNIFLLAVHLTDAFAPASLTQCSRQLCSSILQPKSRYQSVNVHRRIRLHADPSQNVGIVKTLDIKEEDVFDEDDVCMVTFSQASMCSDASADDIAAMAEAQMEPEYLKNLGILLFITLLWAIQTPLVRFVYTSIENRPPITVTNFGSAIAALLTVSFAFAVETARSSNNVDMDTRDEKNKKNPLDAIKGGFELGTYKFIALGLNLWGISLTLASQAAFFIQLTTMIVPVAQAAMGVKLPGRIWAAAAAALSGVGILAYEGTMKASAGGGLSNGGVDLSSLIAGDMLCFLAACFYAAYDVRVNNWGRLARPIPLTFAKTGFQSLYASAGVLTVLVGGGADGVRSVLPVLGTMHDELLQWYGNVVDKPTELATVVGMTAFSGAMANGVATLLQIGAQEVVGPSRAQLVYATNPLWSTLIAVLFLNESIDITGGVGAAMFFTALVLAGTTPPDATTEKPKPNSKIAANDMEMEAAAVEPSKGDLSSAVRAVDNK